MEFKKIGDKTNYVEYNPVLTFGAKQKYKNQIFGLLEMVETKEGKISRYRTVDFKDSVDCYLLLSQINKIVENGEEIPKSKLSAAVLEGISENSENLDKVLEDLRKNNKLITDEAENTEKK